jgi:hypothetical protein
MKVSEPRSKVFAISKSSEDTTPSALTALKGSFVTPPVHLDASVLQREEGDEGRDGDASGERRREDVIVL